MSKSLRGIASVWIGERVRIESKCGNYYKEGIVHKRIPPRTPLTKYEMLKYADLLPGDRFYQSVQGARCKVERVIVEVDEDRYVISPAHLVKEA